MGSAPQLTARIDSLDGVASIALSGELDLATVPVLEDRLAHVEDDGVRVIMLDLRELTFIDSTAVHAIVQARDRAKTNGQRLMLAGASSTARRVFELTGTEFLMEDEDAVGMLDRFTRSA